MDFLRLYILNEDLARLQRVRNTFRRLHRQRIKQQSIMDYHDALLYN